jgi:protein-L-isoaspartate(D-aspartate) O-methyltransferase
MREDLVAFFHTLDRAYFMDNEHRSLAGLDTALPIGFGQTISQPSLVLYMTDKLQLNTHISVLEIGTGSGYQTAFLAEFSKHVYTIERIGALADTAKARLADLGYRNITYRIADGSEGWEARSVRPHHRHTAAPRVIPDDLVAQLATRGIMIIPRTTRVAALLTSPRMHRQRYTRETARCRIRRNERKVLLRTIMSGATFFCTDCFMK